MATLAIGAIGATPYTEVKYKFSDGEAITSKYPIHALIQRKSIKFDKTIVLLTDGAREKHWDGDTGMQAALKITGKAGEICDVSIKDGKNEGELWIIFDAIVENVSNGDELYIDITQGFRHLPVLLLIACTYLRAARNITIKSISYGAFESGTKEQQNGRLVVTECDVFELLPYVALFDWSNATEAFQRSGDAGVLAELLRTSAKGLHPNVSKPLNNVAQKLDNVTLALELARPEEASAEVKELTKELEIGQESLKQYAKPFALLNTLISTTFEKIGLPQTRTGTSSLESKLETQRNLIKWYESKKRLALAVLLAREWLVSEHMVVIKGVNKIDNYDDREDASYDLGNNQKTSPKMHNVWKKLHRVRNDIAHMGQTNQTNNRITARSLQSEIKATLKMLDNVE
ncbi:MAG: TIGR02221 family CRISPR-associated protein [Chloroflexi bacterium]|nr:TIGR02221 family CRISPR-associated protein [Chloroflexota bacterium]